MVVECRMHVRQALESSRLDHHVFLVHHHHLEVQPSDLSLRFNMPAARLHRGLSHRFLGGTVASERVQRI